MDKTGGVSGAPSGHWRATLGLIRADLRRYLGLGAVVALSSGLELFGPLVLARLIDRAAEGADLDALRLLAMVYLAAALGRQVAVVVVSYISTRTAWHTANRLRARLAAHVLGLDHEFHRSRSPGELIERIDGDVTSVSDFLALVVIRVVAVLMLVVGIVAVMAAVDWRLGLGMAAYMTVVGFGLWRRRDHAVDESMAEMSAGAALYGGIEERLAASEELRANGASPYLLHRFVADSGRYLGVVLDRERAFLRLWRDLQGSIVVGTVLALVAGAAGVATGVLTVGTALLLLQYSQRLQRPLEELSDELQLVQKANGAMGRVQALLARRPAVADLGRTEPPPGPLAVTIDDLSFHYDDGEPILEGISLEVPAGTSLGVVGATGSGKTTLMRLVVRLVDATGGSLALGGVAVADIPMAHLRRRVAVIGQHVDLLAGTVADNLLLFADRAGVPGRDDGDPAGRRARNLEDVEDVDRALAAVGLDRFVGCSHLVHLGPGGQGLSAGEAQLLALARVWLRRPDLIVLDEPTARVDPTTEGRLARALDALTEDRTVIIVAHRLSTLDRVDGIAVLDRGRLVEFGPREVLAADPDSRFAHLLRAARVEEPA